MYGKQNFTQILFRLIYLDIVKFQIEFTWEVKDLWQICCHFTVCMNKNFFFILASISTVLYTLIVYLDLILMHINA